MTKIYISKQSTGWEEVEIPEFYKRYSHDALITVAHQFLNTQTCKGILFTENPKPF
jgi:hypothetical protein